MSLLGRLEADGIAWEDGFLARERCGRLLEELEFAYWRPSTVVNLGDDGTMVNFHSETRRSESTTQEWFTPQALSELRAIERRLCRRLRLERDRLEPWQATRYRRGGRFGLHDDGGVFGHEPAGERTVTLLLYLEAPSAGGSTRFPDLGLRVAPRAGRLVVWKNLDRDGLIDRSKRHAASAVRSGVKTTLTSWCRERAARP